MKELYFHSPSSPFTSTNIMSKSNPSALNGVLHQRDELLRNHPHPDEREDHHMSLQHYSKNDSTGSSLSNSHRWSDYTLTRSGSGQCSTYSWGMDEAELDRAATEFVRRKFDRIDAALFEGRSTGTARVDEECKEWRVKFPHFEVRGIHLLDSLEDGTELVAPDPFLALSTPISEDTESPNTSTMLMIQGRKMQPVHLQDLAESDSLYEEFIAVDGTLEEYFAFDNMNEEVHVNESHRHSRLKRHHGLPPVTPNACVREGVMSSAFNHFWTEVISILQPLIAAIRENYSQGHDSAYSVDDNTLTPTEPVLGEGSPQEQPYIQRGLRDPPTLTQASGQSGSKFLRLKYSTPGLQSGLAPTLPQLTNLSGVMQIRSLSLQQRAHSSYVPNVLPISDNSRECTPTPTASERPESSAINLRLTKLATPLPRTSDYQIPPTPAPVPMTLMNMNNRLISSRTTNRRNINTATLRPIEKPKTPALIPIDNGIRGFKLGGSSGAHNSPPSTPFVRHTQLPPLEGGMASVGGQMVLALDRSPTTQVRISAQQQRNRVTFNTRIVSAADGAELWHLSRPAGPGELRPNTTSTPSRHAADGQKASVGRKVSDNNLHFGHMKVVGYAAGFHGGGGGDMREKVSSAAIAEGEEMLEEEQPTSFTVTGKSGIFQSKPRSVSSRTKSRGHIR